MELLLVFGLDVLAEVTRIAECLVAMRTLVRPFATMDSFDMLLEVTSLREGARTLGTAEGFFLGVDSEVLFEFRGFIKYFLTKWTDRVLLSSHGNLT